MDTVLHNRAKQVAGDVLDHLNTKPTNFVAAVLWHDFQIAQPPERDSFMFIKGNGKVSVRKIREQYIIHGSDNLEDIALKMGEMDTPNDTKLNQLNHFDDRFVVFVASNPVIKGATNGIREANISPQPTSTQPASTTSSAMTSNEDQHKNTRSNGEASAITPLKLGLSGSTGQDRNTSFEMSTGRAYDSYKSSAGRAPGGSLNMSSDRRDDSDSLSTRQAPDGSLDKSSSRCDNSHSFSAGRTPDDSRSSSGRQASNALLDRRAPDDFQSLSDHQTPNASLNMSSGRDPHASLDCRAPDDSSSSSARRAPNASLEMYSTHPSATVEASAFSPYSRPGASTPAYSPNSSTTAALRANLIRNPHTITSTQPTTQNGYGYANLTGAPGSATPFTRPGHGSSPQYSPYDYNWESKFGPRSQATPSRASDIKSENNMGNSFGHGPGLSPHPQPEVKTEIKPEAQLPPPLPAQPYIKPDPMHQQSPSNDWAPVDDGDDLVQDVPSSVFLQELANETNTNKLEAGVKQGVKLLDQLGEELLPAAHTDDVQQWMKQIDLVKQDASRTRTVVGVVGNTGAGKSSVINAILDEERLVPTNCMRACTAVVTEISYNYSDDDSSKYRAEVEFIKAEDWEKELKVLFEEVLDGSGNISKEVYNPDSEAGIAYAKMRAVYWRHTKEDLAASSVEKLMHDASVRHLLGTTKNVKDRYCDSFYKSLQHYVDSKEKAETTGKSKTSDEEKKKRKREQEFWPLIKVVRIYVKADALSTGCVLVDLPGVADSNAARAAVAEGYMKQCTGLWIVSPINRAVDDKAAKNLLGASFRRQLKYDGTYSAVTFICSKVDDISNTEAAESLSGLGAEVAGLEDQSQEIDRRLKDVKKQISQLKDQKMAFRQTMDECDDALEKWEDIREKADEGETVYAPKTKSKKRKRVSAESDSDDSNDEESNTQELSQSQSSIDQGLPLSSEDIEAKIHELRDRKKEARRSRNEIEAQIKVGNSRVKEINAEAYDVEAKISQICIAARNAYSKSAIQVDFAAGIKELDQEAAAEENPDEFNPEEDIRDYEEVARSLPVFCVSSRAYQKLSDRFQKDHAVKGFTEVAQTEIPALQEHCKKLTEGVRAVGFRRFLNALSQLRNSLSLWASNDGTGVKMTDQQKDAEQRYLSRKLKDLERALEGSVRDTLTEMKDALNDNIFENYGTALKHASEAALPTSQRWGAHKNDGGLYWATYKATVRRQGVYSGASGPQDFNAQLTEPIYKHLASGWEKAFQRRLPHVLKSCAKSFSDHLRAFHKAIEGHSRGTGGNPRLGLLAQQLKAYENVFSDLAGKMVDTINENQREINREFTPTVCNAMQPAYDICTAESGTGSFKRMKQHMADHVTVQKDIMFQTATQIVRQKLNTMCKAVEEQMADRTDAVFVGMRRDYLQVLSNVRIDDADMMPKSERMLRGQVEDIIKKSEDAFQAVLDGKLEDEEAAATGAENGDAEKDEEMEDAEDDGAKVTKSEDENEGQDCKKDTPADSDGHSDSDFRDVAMTDANSDD